MNSDPGLGLDRLDLAYEFLADNHLFDRRTGDVAGDVLDGKGSGGPSRSGLKKMRQ